MSDDFANHPPSITEIRADRDGDGRQWTVRDALINLLRDIDSGKVSPTDAVVAYAERDLPDGSRTRFVCAGPGGTHVWLGLLNRVGWMINGG